MTALCVHAWSMVSQLALLKSSYSVFSVGLFLAAYFPRRDPALLPASALLPVAFCNSLAVSGTFLTWWLLLDPALPSCIQNNQGFGATAFVVGDLILHHLPSAALLHAAFTNPRIFFSGPAEAIVPFAGMHSLALNLMWGAMVGGFAPDRHYCPLPRPQWRAVWITTAAFHVLAGELLLCIGRRSPSAFTKVDA